MELRWTSPNPNAGQIVAIRKAKSMSYTGCWTCRSRKVKCDERKANGCIICERANLNCAGYDAKLVWLSSEDDWGPRRTRSRRRGLHLDKGNKNLMTEDEVVESLGKLEQSAAKHLCASSGPFSVFPIDSSSPQTPETLAVTPQVVPGVDEFLKTLPGFKDHRTIALENSNAQGSQMDMDERITLDPLNGTLEPRNIYQTRESPLNPSDLHVARHLPSESGLLDDSPSPGFSNQTVSPSVELPNESNHSQSDIEDEEIEIDSNHGDTNVIAVDFLQPTPTEDTIFSSFPTCTDTANTPSIGDEYCSISQGQISPSLDYEVPLPVFEDAETAMLMSHYMNHVACLLQPVFHIGNPFLSIYLPIAVEGSPSLLLAKNSTDMSYGTTAVFHSILATAAYHLRGTDAGEGYFHSLASRHRTKALEATRLALVTAGESSRYKVLMTAMLSLVSIDIMDGGIRDYWIHLDAGTKLQRSRHNARIVSHPTQVLNTICTMLSLLARTAVYDVEPLPWTGKEPFSGEANITSLAQSIEYIYGITPYIARAIFKIVRLSQHLHYYRDRDIPPMLMAACEALGDELTSWTIESEMFLSIDYEQTVTLEVVRCQTCAFYNATLIYYYRVIQGCDRASLQHEQQEVIKSMNRAEDLRQPSSRIGRWGGPITWPAFIAAAEAVGCEREAWEQWWTRVQSYNLRNYHQQWLILQKIWVVIDADSDTKDWREALQHMNWRVIPV